MSPLDRCKESAVGQFLSNSPSTVCNMPPFVLLKLDLPRPAGMGARMDYMILS